MSDNQSCRSQVSDNDLILVRWKDEHDKGYREGVILIAIDRDMTESDMCGIRYLIDNCKQGYDAVIYDRHRHERAIVPLAKVQIVEPRCEQDCDVCEGTGELRVAKWMTSGGEIVQCRLTTDCLVCHGSGKRA